ncbi:MAG: HAD-IA family hydrolase [Pseudomonadota bacterium]
MKSVFFGSIGVVAETSNFQREAYNTALNEAGLPWHWDPKTYRELLNYVGGQDRLRLLSNATAAGLSDNVIETIHSRKTKLACAAIVDAKAPLRAGIELVTGMVKASGGKLGFVTSTSTQNINAIFDLGHESFSRSAMDVVICSDDVKIGKPAPDAYHAALKKTGLAPGDVIAIEDTPSSARAAKRAGLSVILTPGAFASQVETEDADIILPSLTTTDGNLHGAVLNAIGAVEMAV